MNNPFSNIDWSKVSKLKIVVLALVGLLGISVLFSLLTLLSNVFGVTTSSTLEGPYNYGGTSVSNNDSLSFESRSQMPGAPLPTPSYDKGYTPGDDAEQFESVSYDVQYKNGSIEKTCDAVESWKPLKYVVFESATRNDGTCQYRLKVERAQVATILAEIERLDPEEFTARTETMKKQVVEYRGQLDILLRKQQILEKTLEDAMSAYDSVTTLATQNDNVESLTRIITNRLNDVTRLTNERISLSQQIDTLSRRSAELEDAIEYVYFSIRVQKYDVFDFENVKDSWVFKLKNFVYSFNETLQNLTIGVLELFLTLVQGILYVGVVCAVVAIVGKYGWRILKAFLAK